MFVEDYMTPDPVTVQEGAQLIEAGTLMHQHRVRQLPVLDEQRRLVGIITDRDVRGTAAFDRTLDEKLKVADVMTSDPTTIPVSATIDETVEVLSTRRFGALPVVRSTELVGIISYIDVLRAFTEVFGLDKPGRRIEVALPDGYADIARAFEALKDCTGQILGAVVSRTRRDGGEPALYLRVSSDEAAQVERRLRAAMMILLEPDRLKGG